MFSFNLARFACLALITAHVAACMPQAPTPRATDTSENIASNSEWSKFLVSERLTESNAKFPAFEIDIQYPQFSNLEKSTAHAINSNVLADVKKEVAVFRKIVSDTAAANDLDPVMNTATPLYVSAEFEIGMISPEFLSFRLKYSNFTGGAHGAHWTSVHNYRLQPFRQLTIENLFTDQHKGLERLSSLSKAQFLGESPDKDKIEWVEKGSAPNIENFKNFLITNQALVVVFNEYQVASYSEGEQLMRVPHQDLADMYSPESGLIELRVQTSH